MIFSKLTVRCETSLSLKPTKTEEADVAPRKHIAFCTEVHLFF